MAAHVRVAASNQIAEHVRTLFETNNLLKTTVALYAPKGTEVDTSAIDAGVRDAGGRVVYPRVVDNAQELAFHCVMPDQLIAGRFGLREPRADDPTRVCLADICAFVVPGLAFDRNGWRIGWGRGHYDATLSSALPQSLQLGIAYECQIINQAPHEPHDAQLHYVVTELATYKAP